MTKRIIFSLLLALMVFLGFSNQTLGQSIGEISGKLIDEERKPIPYASVSLLNAKDATAVKGNLTDDNGNYQFKGLDVGSYLLAIYVVGHKKVVKGPYIITSDSKSVIVANIQLNSDAKQLKDVEIVTQKPLIERQIDKTILNIENSILATGNNALEILEKAPGVTVDKDGKVSLRGRQGVNVMLDGKPANLSNEQLANLLRSTSGSTIQSIELIANPSAKYDAAGNSGIINIKLKKNRNYGLNGSATAGAGYGVHPKVNGGLNMNYRNRKFNLYGNADYSFNKRFQEMDILRVNETKTDQTYFDQTSHNETKRYNHNYKAGIDYSINPNHTLGFFVNGYHSNGSGNTDVFTLIGNKPSVIDSSVVALNTSTAKYTGITYNLNYRGILDTLGQEISMDIDYSQHNNNQESVFNNRYKSAVGNLLKPDYTFRNASPSIVKIYGAKIDYSLPLNKTVKLEFGVKTSFVKTDNNFQFENFKEKAWKNDVMRSNRFIYNEHINAAYASIKKKFNTTTVQLGVRTEQTNSIGNSVTEAKVVKRNYFNLFPSLFINQELSKDHEMGFSYSRRVDRPNYESLNPFVYYLDLYSYRFGNPFLKPQYTNSIEFSYSLKKKLNVSMGYSHTNDVMTGVLLTDTAKKTIFNFVQNLAKQDSYYINLNYPVAITKWWNSHNNLTTFYNKFQTPDLLGFDYSGGRLSFNLNTNHSITINPSTKIEWSGIYESKMVAGTLLIASRYRFDLGAGKSFINNNLNFRFSANDVFNLQRNRFTSAMPSQNYLVKERWESRVFQLACTYRFGSNEINAARQRSGSSENESRRVNKTF